MSKLAGAAVFVVTLVAALLVTSYYNPRPEQPPPPPPYATVVDDPPPMQDSPPPSWRTQVTHKVRLVTLDVAARRSHATLTIEHAPDADPPEKLWVWVGFFVPGDAGSELFAGEPVLVEQPFASGRRANVNVSAACPWCGQRDAPAAGYYAHVNVSTVSASDARLEDEQVSRDLSKATQVTVEEGRRKKR